MTQDVTKTFYRGVAADSLNQLIESRLTMQNPYEHKPRLRGFEAPGVFFTPSREGAISQTLRIGYVFGKDLPGVLSVTITPNNFDFVKKGIWNIYLYREGRRVSLPKYEYTQPTTFTDLYLGKVCINISSLSDEVLYDLNAQFGRFIDAQLRFLPYQELRERFLRGGYEGDLPFSPTRRTKEG